ncbi:beta-propeller protein [Raphanus sativus]|uniref:Uncharacterized protein LOC108814105 n=1 Tax=Raphanus sativus TaxID=3726 RepID=A0A6J0K3R6_RAPSA|nr:uncharacterized protein LOC108814105 [Raphanus sativus]XP_056847041.1 uncharacterized protein LOC108814105 [Raphanus sativus]KAJ4882231.1 beta-propeller protein [Raphanus sativus]
MAQSRANHRNLTKTQLGGVVFGCTKHTINECLSKHLFGLPYNHFSYVQNIDTALPLFLFNYSDRKLHGLFEAAGPGHLNIDPYAWTSNGSDRTSFPAQVQISARLQCEPLSEQIFKPAIQDNYYSSHHFWFELDHLQTNKLICLLSSFPLKPNPPPLLTRQLFHFPPSPHPHIRVNMDQPSNSEPIDTLEVEVEVEASPAPQDCLLEELKDLALTHPHNSLMLTVDQPNVPTTDRDEETCKIAGKGDGGSSPRQHTIIQLMQEVKELKAYGIENSTKICYLEEKLGEAHTEIHRLRERCNMLESKIATSSDTREIHLPDDSNLDSTEAAILLLGGFDGYSESGLSSVQSYFPSRNVVKAHSSMTSIRSNASVAKLDGKVYVFGGDEGGNGWTNTVESYNETDGGWSLCSPLNDRKGNLGGATLDGKIFAIGGGNVEVVFSDVEMLDPDIGRWIRTRSMEHKRFAVAATEHNGSIYAVGGFDGKEYLNTAERFDPREHSWMRIASMKSRRGCHSLAVLNEKLYAIGGYDGSTMVSSVEIYEPRRGTWIEGEAMKEARGYSAAAVVKDCIYVIGGYKGEGVDILDTVECFKDGKGWEKVPCSSMGRRGFLSAVAL